MPATCRRRSRINLNLNTWGVDVMDGALVISPHLDDAVFSCGDWIAAHPGATVMTVFAGVPVGTSECTPWDAACGFEDARQAVTARRLEDDAALAMLSAKPLWLDFLDSQYLQTPAEGELRQAMGDVLERTAPATVLFPAGLYHSDHAIVHDAMLSLCRAQPCRHWIMYEDALYRRRAGRLQRRLAALLEDGFCATPVAAQERHPGRKHAAIACYRSQLRALGKPADVVAPEGYWRLEVSAWRAPVSP